MIWEASGLDPEVVHDRGEPIGAVDVLIAGTAAEQNDSRVLTRNTGEFERVESISVESY